MSANHELASDCFAEAKAENSRLLEIVRKLARADCECDPSYNTTTCFRCEAARALSLPSNRGDA